MDIVTDHGLHGEVAQPLLAQRVGPPQRGISHIHMPLDPVLAVGCVVVVGVLGAGHSRAQLHGPPAGDVEHCPQFQPCRGPPVTSAPASVVGDADLGAHRPSVTDRHRPAGAQAHRPPHPAHDQVVDPAQLRILEGAREQGAVVGVAEAAAGCVDGQQMVGPSRQLLGDLQLVGHEVPVGIAQVGAVEPDVALLRQPLDSQPPAPAAAISSPGGTGRLLWPLEAMPVQHRLLAGEVRVPASGRGLSPMAGHPHRGPARVVVVELVERAPPSLGGRGDPPRTAQVHPVTVPGGAVLGRGRRLLRALGGGVVGGGRRLCGLSAPPFLVGAGRR